MASILYCVEAVTLEKATIVELDRLQCMVGRFILQIPHSSSKVLTWMDAGLMPMAHRIQTRQALFIWSILKSKFNTLLMEVLRELLDHPTDPWVKSINQKRSFLCHCSLPAVEVVPTSGFCE